MTERIRPKKRRLERGKLQVGVEIERSVAVEELVDVRGADLYEEMCV